MNLLYPLKSAERLHCASHYSSWLSFPLPAAARPKTAPRAITTKA